MGDKWKWPVSAVAVAGVLGTLIFLIEGDRSNPVRPELIVFDDIQLESGAISNALSKTQNETVFDAEDELSALDHKQYCNSVFVEGANSNLGLVVSSDNEEESEYRIYGDDGLVLQGKLPFRPNIQQVAQRSDGSQLVAVADLRLNSKVQKDAQTDEPAHVYLNEQLIYQTEKALDLQVAPNGSGFFVVEPLASSTTQLRVQNLDTGQHFTVPLENARTEVNSELTATLRYSPVGDEIEMVNLAAGELESTFYSMEDEEPIRREIPDTQAYSALYASSDVAYTISHQPDSYNPVVSKIRFSNSDNNDHVVEWSAVFEDTGALSKSHLDLQDNGNWLVISGFSIKVLDTNTGQSKFSYNQNKQSQKRVLQNVASSANEEPGQIKRIAVDGGQVRLHREIAHLEVNRCFIDPTVDREECLEEYRESGMLREYFDYFPTDEDGDFAAEPSHRIAFEPHSICGNGVLQGFQLAEDQSGKIHVKNLDSES